MLAPIGWVAYILPRFKFDMSRDPPHAGLQGKGSGCEWSRSIRPYIAGITSLASSLVEVGRMAAAPSSPGTRECAVSS